MHLPSRSLEVHSSHLSSPTIPQCLMAPKELCCKDKILMRYIRQVPRTYVKEYISLLPPIERKLDNLPAHVKRMNVNAAENYRFQTEEVSAGIGPDAFYEMLHLFGASSSCMTREWVSNHYKWIVWKLSSYERCCPEKFSGKLLKVSNVLEELQYRYEREVNQGHRSAIKKLLDGDAPPSAMMVLCISSVGDFGDIKSAPNENSNNIAAKIELTDGWYSMKALLDEPLSQKLVSGKLFLGQKLKVWGAKLCGWMGPISPLEDSLTSSLSLHINGTYRCHWAERLGFCRNAGVPLAFRCIKGDGGPIPCTLVGIARIYPILYRERLSNGKFTLRFERIERDVEQLFNQRRLAVVEGITSAFQWANSVDMDYGHDSEEGANIMKLLEITAEPDILMAGMSAKQLNSFASYKSKLEATRQTNMQISIEKALETAGLKEREVAPFMRVRVVGLMTKCHSERYDVKEGLITIWNPTEKLKLELVEGKAYSLGGVIPTSADSTILNLLARGSTTNWIPLSPLITDKFEPFFTPRSSATISNFGELSFSREFDIAAFVVYVGELYVQGHQKKQWVFVADGSTPEFCSRGSFDLLLAVSFCMPHVECDPFEPFAPVNYNIAGSVAGFSNLIKRHRDQTNGLWVAEATENSEYFLSYEDERHKHLKSTATSVSLWAKTSSMVIEKLKEYINSIIKHSN